MIYREPLRCKNPRCTTRQPRFFVTASLARLEPGARGHYCEDCARDIRNARLIRPGRRWVTHAGGRP